MRYICELREGEMLNGIYLCKTKQTLKTKAGKSYYSMILQDKTGTIDAKVWDLNNAISHFEAMDYISIVGQVISFQGNPQLNVQKIRVASEGEYDPADYMPMTKKSIDNMYETVLKYVNSISDQYVKKLLQSFFVDDKEFIKKFKFSSAAKSVHHNFIGGLLEHTLGVTNMCEYMTKMYPVLNRDLLIASALFHDIGKVDELSPLPENDYTDDGQFLGHIFIGAEMVGARIKQIPNFPKKLASEIKHCILAHHGELEYGSPKKPVIIEAVALTYADNVDAKLQTFTQVLEAAEEKEEWLGYNRFFESNLRRS